MAFPPVVPEAENTARVFGARYRVEALLGHGSFGVVHRVRDLLHDRDIALKTVRRLGTEGVQGIKREFRTLATLSHRNLVRLYDLVVDDRECFFTMELVRGTDFVQWVGAASPGARMARLRASFLELATAVGVLHGHGTLHRDLKPRNVLAEPDGRIVVLDFGVATRFGRWRTGRDRADEVAGSIDYMAPELLWGETTSTASDWYSVGAMLFEALTGRRPYDATEAFDLSRRRERPPSPQEYASDVPDDVARLTERLLDPNPARRPDLDEIREALVLPGARGGPPVTRALAAGDARFVGRRVEIDQLTAMIARLRDGAAVTALVQGGSGIGKTALVTQALATCDDVGDVLVLRGRCHPKETVPFKAMDSIVEELAATLFAWPTPLDDCLPPDLDCLAQLFPVLARVPAIRDQCAGSSDEREPVEVRRRAVLALAQLLARLAAQQPIVVWIDDLQWADRDGAQLLRELRMQPERGRVGFFFSFRSEDERTATALRILLHDEPASVAEDVLTIRLGPLAPVDSRALAEEVLRAVAIDDPAEVESIVQAAGGIPFFSCEFARERARGYGPRSDPRGDPPDASPLERLLAGRMTCLPEGPRRVLQLVALAGQPFAEAVFQRADAECDVPHAIVALANDCLVRYVPGALQPEITTYHDRIRETVLAEVADPDRRVLHARLAKALEASAERDPEVLFEHWLGANRLERAVPYAIAGAERAWAALAFNRAAELYRHALALGGGPLPAWELRARLGEALVNAGLGAQGATELAAAADARAAIDPNDLEVVRFRRRAAEHFLRSGRHPEGLAALRRVLAALGVGYPRTTVAALTSLIGKRTLLRLRRTRAAVQPSLSARDRERLEACWSAGLGLGLFDTLRAADFQVRHALLAHRAGDVGHLARALLIEAFLLSWEGGAAKRSRSVRLRDEGERLAVESGNPNVQAFGLVLRGVTDLYLRRFASSLAICDTAEALCRDRCVGASWELSNVRTLRGIDLAFMGEFARLADYMRDELRQAETTGDLYYSVNARLGMTNAAWLAADRPDEARRQAELALSGPFPSTFSWQVYQGAMAHAHIDLYVGDGRAAFTRVAKAWTRLRVQQLLRFQTPRLEMADLRARAALAAAAHPDCPANHRARYLRRAARDAHRLLREELEWPRALADAITAGIAGARGDEAQAAHLLDRAARGFDAHGLVLHAACARRHLDAAGRQRGEAERWLAERGVRNPKAMAATFVPNPFV